MGRQKEARRLRRLAIYEEVIRLYREGHSLRAIALKTGKSRHTVRKCVPYNLFAEIKQ
jgi:transposase